MPHPELQKAFGASGSIPKVRVPKAPEGVIAGLACASKQVDESELLQGRVKETSKDVRWLKWFSVPGAEDLRRLLEALQARPEDQLLARQGTIATNELVRRAKSVMSIRAAKRAEKLTRASVVGCNTICKWLRSEGMPRNTKQIVGEARRLLIDAEDHKRFPAGAVPPGMQIAEIIRRSRPAQPEPDGAEQVSWRAFWRAVWVYRSMPNERMQAAQIPAP